MRNNKPSVLRDILEIIAFFAVCALLIWLMLTAIKAVAGYVRAEAADGQLRVDTVSEGCGVGRATGYLNGVLLLGGETDVPARNTALRVYTEGVDNPLPEWWNPDEPMAVEWYADDHFAEAGNMVEAEPHPPELISTNGVDWNIETDIHGWEGHTMTGVELDLFSRIAYLEVWGSSDECCKAVVDAILVLWDEQYFGRTMFETLSAVTESGSYAFSTFPWVWTVDYDVEGLNEMRELCWERFMNGYEYTAPFFRTDYFHPWAVDGYVIENVYFSYSPWG